MDYEEFQKLKKQMAKVPPPSSPLPVEVDYIDTFLDEIEEEENGN